MIPHPSPPFNGNVQIRYCLCIIPLDFVKKRNYTILKTNENMYFLNLLVLDFVRRFFISFVHFLSYTGCVH